MGNNRGSKCSSPLGKTLNSSWVELLNQQSLTRSETLIHSLNDYSEKRTKGR